MPRPRNRPQVSNANYLDVAEDIWEAIRTCEYGPFAANPGRPGATQGELLGTGLYSKITKTDQPFLQNVIKVIMELAP